MNQENIKIEKSNYTISNMVFCKIRLNKNDQNIRVIIKKTKNTQFLYIFSLCFFVIIFQYEHDAKAEQIPSAGQIVPGSFASPLTNTKTLPLGGDRTAPESVSGGAKIFLQIGDVKFGGLDPRFETQAGKWIAPIKGTRRPVSDLYDLASKVQKLYSDDGSFLTRVIIPPQNVKDGGTVTLKVVEGFIAEINTDALPSEVRERVARYFASLTGKPGLKLAVFQRALLLAAGTNGLKLKTNLKPAKESFGVTLTVSGDLDPVSGQIGIDNSLPASLGTYQTTLSAAFNSPFHLGEQVYLSASGSPFDGGIDPQAPRRVFAAGITAPLFDDGLSSNLEYTWSGTMPMVGKNALATSSRFQRITAKLSYPMILDHTSTLTAHLAFEDTDEINRATAFKSTLYHDHLDVLRTGFDYSRTFLGGLQVSTGLDVSQGISGLWGRGANEARHGDPISQSGASDRFTKLQARLHLYQEFDNGLAWDLAARGQYVPTGVVMNSEKFVIGGTGDLSGSDSGGWSGDHGWSVRAELQFNATRSLNIPNFGLKSYVFASRGQVYLDHPLSGELGTDGATGFGIGLRGQWMPQNYSAHPVDFALELARNLSDHPNQKPSEWRINMSMGVRF